MINDKVGQIMNYSRWGIGASFLATAWWIGLTGVSNASEREYETLSKRGNVVQLSEQANTYRAECGACHLAYPAQLLPVSSWKTIMTQLDDHFGENAELAPDVAEGISQYLIDNAGTEGRGFLKRMKDPAPLRITALPYFVRKHDEIPDRLVKGNPKVGSFSDCSVCHEGAINGEFDEDTVTIPGYGRWDD